MSKRPTPETDAVRAYEGNWDTKALRMTAHARKLERERDEAIAQAHNFEQGYHIHSARADEAIRERDELRGETPWGANNETKESWFERQREKFQYLEAELEKTRRERNEARRHCESIVDKANELIARWDQPSWKDTAPTAGFIHALRDAVEDYEKQKP